MSFDADFLALAAPVLKEQFGESVVYRPASGAPRTITAHWIDRDVESIDGIPRGVAMTFRVQVDSHATTGITLDEAKQGMGRDKIDIATVKGGTLVTRTLRRLVDAESDTGTVVIEAD